MNIPFYEQINGYTCGPACVQMIFAFYGIKVDQEDLIKELETNSEVGTEHENIIRIMGEHGLYSYVNNDSSLEEVTYYLEKDFPVLVHYIEPDGDEGHYALMTAVKDTVVVLHDPWNGEGFELQKEEFLRRWVDSRNMYHNWIMVVSKDDFNLGRQYVPNIE